MKSIRRYGLLALFHLLLFQALSLPAASIKTWDGSTSGYWGTGANWSGNVAPVTGDSLVFPVSATRYTTTNNIANLTVATIAFDGSNYIHYGNAVTNNGDITLNNTGGTNIIRFDLTLGAGQMFDVNGGATARFLVNTNVNLNGYNLTFDSGASGAIEVNGVISGTGNLRKNSAGTLRISGGAHNAYTGWFYVAAGTLELNKTPNYNAITGALTNSGTVRHIQSFQIPTVPIVLLSGSLLDLNDKSDTIGALTMTGATVDTGTGTLTLGGNLTNVVSSTSSTINGNLGLGTSTRTFHIESGSAGPYLRIYANISGSGTAGIVFTGSGRVYLQGDNTYPGLTTLNGAAVYLVSGTALGSTAGATVINSNYLYLVSADIGNEALTINRLPNASALYASGPCSWGGPVTLNQDVQLTSLTSYMIFNNAISGAGGLTLETLEGNGSFEFAGTNANYYTGATSVKCLELRLNKTGSGTNSVAIPGDLSIGSGAGASNVVRLLASQQIGNSAEITFHTNAVLNGNGYTDTIGSLTFNGGRVDNSGSGVFYLNTGAGLTVNPTNVVATINGTLSLFSGTHPFNVGAGSASPDLRLNADIVGSGSITFTGDGGVYVLGDNTYSGATTLNGPVVFAYSDTALGSTAGATVINSNSSYLYLASADIGNETLTINRSPGGFYALYASGNCSWGGPITLNNDAQFYAYNTFIVSNTISGGGGLTLYGSTFEIGGIAANTYAGDTYANCALLRLNKASTGTQNAIPHDLIIGGGSSASNVVQHLGSYQIADTASLTFQTNAVLNVNGFLDTVGSLIFNGGRIDTGAGRLALGTSANVTVNPPSSTAEINGELSLASGSHTFEIGTRIRLNADITGGGSISYTGHGYVDLFGNNLYTGLTMLNGAAVNAYSDTALGSTAGATVINSNYLYLGKVDIGNETLTNNRPAAYGWAIYATDVCSWSGPIVLNVDSSFRSATSPFVLSNTISGPGGLSLSGEIFEFTGTNGNTYAGTTKVQCDLLRLNKTGTGLNSIAVPADLAIGGADTGVSNVVRFLGNNQIMNGSDLTFQTNGVLNMNGFSDTVGNLTFNGGRVDNASSIYPADITVNPSDWTAEINGTLSLSAGTHTFNIGSGTAHPDLRLNANITGAGSIVLTGQGVVSLYGDNTYTGLTSVNGPGVRLYTDTALGSTSSGTVINSNSSYLYLSVVNIGNESLTNNRPAGGDYTLHALGASSWSGPIVLNDDAIFRSYDTLIVSNTISGAGGLSLIGETFELAGSAANTYAGDTYAKCTLLRLHKPGGGQNAIPHGLIIGDQYSGASNVVQHLASYQIADTAPLTFQTNAVLNVNGFIDTVGSLTFNGGRIDTGAGWLRLNGGGTVNTTNVSAVINGTLDLPAGTHTFTVGAGVASPDLRINANITGAGHLTLAGTGGVYLNGDNTYSGLTALNGAAVWTWSNTGLGSTNGATVINSNSSYLYLMGVNIGNESLTNNQPAGGWTLAAAGVCSWNGPVIMNTDAEFFVNNGASLSLSNILSGAAGFTKTGLGTLRLVGPAGNTYAGDTFLNEGLTELGKTTGTGAAIRYGRLTIGDGTGGADADVVRYLADGQLWSSVPVTITSSGLLDLNGFVDTLGALTFTGGRATSGAGGEMRLQGTVVATNGSGTLQGNATLNGTRTFDVASTRVLYLEANLSGAGGLTKTGPGQLYLSSSNSYQGITTISQGRLYADNDFALGTNTVGTTVSAGAALVLRYDTHIGSEPLALNGSGDATLGALASIYGSNSWAGPITLGSATRLTTLQTSDDLNLSGAIGGTGSLTLEGAGTVLYSGISANTYTNTTYVNQGTLVLGRSLANTAINGPLVVGDGSGGTDADVVRITVDSQIANSAPVIIQNSGLIQVEVYAERVGSLTGSGHLQIGAAREFVVQLPTGKDEEFNGLISGPSGQFSKVGGGQLTLSGTNTYTGKTLIGEGTLLVNGPQAASFVEVWYGATLGGFGTVGSIANEGTVSPGTSPGTLTSSNVAFTAGSTFAVELTGAGSDQLNVRGTNNLGSATLTLNTSGLSPVQGQTFTILNNDGGEPIVGTFAGLSEGSLVSVGAQQFAISYIGGNGNDVTLTFTNAAIQVAGVTLSAGNGNGVVDANECDFLNVVLTNNSAYLLSGATATLTPVTPGVAVTYPASAYADIVPHAQGTNVETFQFATWPNFAASCGNDVQLNLTLQSASHGTFTLPVSLPSGSPDTAFSYSNLNPYGIPDDASVTSSLAVATFSGTLAKVTVSMFATHGLDADLDMYLIGPDGTIVELTSDNGGLGNSYGSACTPSTSRTTFDDAAATSITAGAAPFTGTYRPEGALSAFRGKSGAAVNGTWRLVVTDDAANGQFGALNCWYLTLYNAACTDGGGVCESCPDRVIRGAITASSLSQNGRLNRDGVVSACGTLKSYPGNAASGSGRYCDYYTFINGESNACIQVSLTGSADLFSAAYRNAFNPASLSENYLADMGSSTVSGGNTYAFNVAAGAVFVVVVNQINTTNFGDYTLAVTGGSCRPLLNIAPAAANRVAVGWSTAAVGYQLMQTNALGNPPGQPWTPSFYNPIVTGSKFSVTNHTTIFSPQRFYELRKP